MVLLLDGRCSLHCERLRVAFFLSHRAIQLDVKQVPATRSRTRPYFLRLIANTTLSNFLSRYGCVAALPGHAFFWSGGFSFHRWLHSCYHRDIFTPELLTGYKCFINNFNKIRRFWSQSPLTLCHGDPHLGNLWYVYLFSAQSPWFAPLMRCVLPKIDRFSKGGSECGFFDMQCAAAVVLHKRQRRCSC